MKYHDLVKEAAIRFVCGNNLDLMERLLEKRAGWGDYFGFGMKGMAAPLPTTRGRVGSSGFRVGNAKQEQTFLPGQGAAYARKMGNPMVSDLRKPPAIATAAAPKATPNKANLVSGAQSAGARTGGAQRVANSIINS